MYGLMHWPRRDLNTQPFDLESNALPLRHAVMTFVFINLIYIVLISPRISIWFLWVSKIIFTTTYNSYGIIKLLKFTHRTMYTVIWFKIILIINVGCVNNIFMISNYQTHQWNKSAIKVMHFDVIKYFCYPSLHRPL